ncbi:FecR protein [Chitinophaga dinghuensis]|uniref:FecR protein n=1 Tax=Chitinophaga dinghuensis TaxID=1539050 RepID=A0A327VX63_9BACT|nr:FecR family protein [Chitinophaga dinghuensis]RAJ80072.1 FecR protein [Chitinophaga dinghuensis]
MNHQDLYNKIASGQATEAEIAAFNQHMHSLEGNVLEQAIDGYIQAVDAQTITTAADEQSLQRLMAKIDQRETPGAKIIRLPWRATAAAAVIAGMLATGAWYFMRSAERAPLAVNQVIKPTGNQAVLTLGNGQQVVLDNTQKGALSMQQGTAVDSGKITYQPGTETVEYNTLSTPRGMQYQVILPDGSHVWLNAASSLRYPTAFTGNQRVVELSGEAYFDVAPKASQAFLVKTRNSTVTVLGTAFNLMAYDDETTVNTTLINGAVKVNEVVLKPGEQASVGNHTQVSRVDTSEVLAWKEGRFKFKNADIRKIMRQVARWYNVDISYSDSIEVEGLSGDVQQQQHIDQLLETLEATGDVKFMISGRKITVMPAKH